MELQLPISAAGLAAELGASLIGDPDREVRAVASLESASRGDVAYCQHRKFRAALHRAREAVVLTTEELVDPSLPLTFLIVSNPQLAFAKIAGGLVKRPPAEGRHSTAIISPLAHVEASASIGPTAVIERGARIGARSHVMAGAYVGEDVLLGDDCLVFPGVRILAGTEIGNRVTIFPGTVIGSDGFGLIPDGGGYRDVPHIGRVVIEDDVRIGANCTVDRAAIGETRIGSGSRLDNAVHVAHNCRIGKHCVLCAQVGLAGSVELEDYVMLGGQVGIADHVRIGRGARIGAQSGTSIDLPAGGTYMGTPAVPMKEFLKNFKLIRKLASLAERLTGLEASAQGGRSSCET